MERLNLELRTQLNSYRNTLPEVILNRQFEKFPEIVDRYKGPLRKFCIMDIEYHLVYLAEAIALEQNVLFTEYIAWNKSFFEGIGLPHEDIINTLKVTKEILEEKLSSEMSKITSQVLDLGIEKYITFNPEIPSFIYSENPFESLANEYLEHLLKGDRIYSLNLVMKAYMEGTSIRDLYLNVFQPTQLEIGRLWQLNKITVAQEHFVTAATQLIMSQLYPYLFQSTKSEGNIVVSCINGELHEMGARMVADFFEMEGWNTYYLGANTPNASVIKMLETTNANVLALSATMTFNLESVSTLISQVKNNEATKNIKIMVGGYPFNLADNLWQTIGADGFAGDAQTAINLTKKFMNQ